MNCAKCGQQIDDSQTKFCPNCGNNLQGNVDKKVVGIFCRNCGKQLLGKPEICMNCGARPLSGNSYCPACGVATNAQAVICIKCGARLETKTADFNKSKTTSVLLAVFLSFWTWLYTYKKDKWKFWVGLALSVLFPLGALFIIRYFALLAFGIWIWAIIDVSVKKREWYQAI